MRLIDADELMEHVWRDKLDSRESIAKMINDAQTVKDIPTKIPINVFEQLISKAYSDGVNEVLDKIRAEIEEMPKTYPFVNHLNTYVKDDVIKIIDKYKEEDSEG